MNTKNINVLLIEDDSDYAEVVEQWLSTTTTGEHFCLRWTDSLEQGLSRLAEGAVDVILLDLGLPDSDGPPTFAAIESHAKGIPVIVLSAAGNESVALRMIQDGAADYLVKSNCSADLLVRALRYAIVRHRTQLSKLNGESREGARVIGVIGAKGGVGVTTVACNLAEELSRQTAQKVLLADLDIHRGSVSFLMGLESKYSVLDAVGNIDRLDANCWERIVTQKGENLSILASPTSLGVVEPDAAVVQSVFKLMGPFYQWVVLDLGPLSPLSRALLDSADEVLLVTTAEIPSLYLAKRMIDEFVQEGLERDRFRVVLNRGDEWQAWSHRELHKMFGIQVAASLPNGSQDLHDACVERRMPSETSKIRREIARLAQRVAGLPEPPSNHGLARFFPFVERSRKTDESQHLPLTP